MAWQLLHGPAIDMLRTLPDASVDCIVTSPPYWGLRKYGEDPGMIGLEPTLQEYLSNLLDVFTECHRVLKATGTMWVNMGDAYAGSWGGQGGPSNLSVPRKGVNPEKAPNQHGSGLPPKSLIGQPWRVAFALQDMGFILRSDIIWEKPTAMPESVRDRCTMSHEYIFMFAKSRCYWYDARAIAEPCKEPIRQEVTPAGWDTGPGSHATIDHATVKVPASYKGSVPGRKFGEGQDRRSTKDRGAGDRAEASGRMGREPGWRAGLAQPATRNCRTVWTICAEPFKGAHFASFPSEIPRRCILAGCPPGGVVLDPFAGTGTTLAVALAHGRQAIGIEINAEYCDLIRERISRVQLPIVFTEATA